MNKIIIILCFFCLAFFLIEKFILRKKHSKFKYIVHVNGIRGKSSVCRLIDAGMRSGGYRVFTKITGTSPRVITVSNEEKMINRLGKANINEQIDAINWAAKENAEVLILECMAVDPIYQNICENSIVDSNIGVITNVREDHLDLMGETKDKIALSLSNTIPNSGYLFTSDRHYFNFFSEIAGKKDTKTILSYPSKEEQDYSYIDFPENVKIALDICKMIGIPEDKVLKGLENYKKDPGKWKVIKYKNKIDKDIFFINAMAANDPDSTKIILDNIKDKYYFCSNKYLFISNREDRVSRSLQYVDFAYDNYDSFDKIILFGDNTQLLLKKIKEKFIKSKGSQYIKLVQEWFFCIIDKDNIENLFDEQITDTCIFAVGNICGKGIKLIEKLEKEGEEING